MWGRTHNPSHLPPFGQSNVDPGTRNHLTRDRSPVTCKQSSMCCQYRAYCAGGLNGNAPLGTSGENGSPHAPNNKTAAYPMCALRGVKYDTSSGYAD